MPTVFQRLPGTEQASLSLPAIPPVPHLCLRDLFLNIHCLARVPAVDQDVNARALLAGAGPDVGVCVRDRHKSGIFCNQAGPHSEWQEDLSQPPAPAPSKCDVSLGKSNFFLSEGPLQARVLPPSLPMARCCITLQDRPLPSASQLPSWLNTPAGGLKPPMAPRQGFAPGIHPGVP